MRIAYGSRFRYNVPWATSFVLGHVHHEREPLLSWDTFYHECKPAGEVVLFMLSNYVILSGAKNLKDQILRRDSPSLRSGSSLLRMTKGNSYLKMMLPS